MRVVRRYEYNRRGQRTVAADTVTLAGPGTLTGERKGRIDYTYDAAGRLTTVLATVDSGSGLTYARIRYFYDRGGRDTLRVIRMSPLAPVSGAGDSILTRTTYDCRRPGQLHPEPECQDQQDLVQFGSPVYNAVSDLTGYSAIERVTGNHTYSMTYSGDGTRRLLTSSHTFPSGGSTAHVWKYDVFGNRAYENRNSSVYSSEGMSGCNNLPDTLLYSPDDNRLLRRTKGGCTDKTTYYTDQAGNRLAQRDTLNGGATLRTQKMTYTAANQLYHTLTATEAIGVYDANWHWYDASGMRIMTHAQLTNSWFPDFKPDSGFRTFYYYDGSDVALTVVRGNANNYWVGQRYLTGGVDNQLAGRFTNTGGAVTSLVLVGARDGTPIVNVKADGTEDLYSTVIPRGPFGTLEGGGAPSGTNAQTGFAGASTPNQTGGFVYLRNRWYDPKTGRFLTQDPIGLAGGVNLYAYAGNNPVSFADPFGLCPGKVKSGRICISFFIQTEKAARGLLNGDNRGFSSSSEKNQSRAYVIVNPDFPQSSTPVVNKTCSGDYCSGPLNTNRFSVTADGDGGFNVNVSLTNAILPGPSIDASLHFTEASDGNWNVTGTRDGYPSLEAYYYRRDGSVQTIINDPEDKQSGGGKLWGCCDRKISTNN